MTAKSAAMVLILGTQERVRKSRDKQASVTEVLLSALLHYILSNVWKNR